jgi:hypothetical protein
VEHPRQWTLAELTADATRSAAAFRRQRLDEPLALYSRFFKAFCPVFGRLVRQLPSLIRDGQCLPEVLDTPEARAAFRYLAAPPISEDDLKSLAESRLSPKQLRTNAEEARRVRDVVLHVIDPHRFPWAFAGRRPLPYELRTAIVASAALAAAKKVETLRRTDARKRQEDEVKALLASAGFASVPRRKMLLLDDAPPAGHFCAESMLGPTRADIVVRLFDRRVMPIECKVSNSAVNSFKRVNHEAAGKAQQWLDAFGARATVPAAVLAGVFKPANLDTAQGDGLSLFWQHRLGDLADFLRKTR